VGKGRNGGGRGESAADGRRFVAYLCTAANDMSALAIR